MLYFIHLFCLLNLLYNVFSFPFYILFIAFLVILQRKRKTQKDHMMYVLTFHTINLHQTTKIKKSTCKSTQFQFFKVKKQTKRKPKRLQAALKTFFRIFPKCYKNHNYRTSFEKVVIFAQVYINLFMIKDLHN